MTADNEVRGSILAQKVEEIEKLIRSGADVRGTSLASLLNTAEMQLQANRQEDEHAATEKKEKEEKDRSAIAQMVEREAKLNEEEKKKYSEFLAKDYFTKSDLGELDKFYADGGAYDRLSHDGKVQMSERIEEGIRRGEISREDLSEKINRKNDAIRGAKDAPEIKNSGNYRNESSILEDSLSPVKQPEKEAKPDSQPSKGDMPDGLAGLAKLSPVQETDKVVVPQTERGGQGQTRGG